MNEYKHLSLKQLYGYSIMKWERIQKRLDEEYYLDETEGELDHYELRMDMSEECAFCYDTGRNRIDDYSCLELDCKNCRIDNKICDEGSIHSIEDNGPKTVAWILSELKKKYYELEKESEAE